MTALQPTLSLSSQKPLRTRAVPPYSNLLVRWFTWYSRRYLMRHFHSLRVSRAGSPPVGWTGPLVVFINHSSWWDPLVALLVGSAFFAGRKSFAPIDAAAAAKYKLLLKMGLFPVEQNSRRGAVEFLRRAAAILSDPKHILWMTPQGGFADARQKPVFRPGLGHLVNVRGNALFLPLAIEYSFWEERLPEVLVRFGKPLQVSNAENHALNPRDWTVLFEQALAATQSELADEVVRRNPADFGNILRGRVGVGGIYDWWRTARAALEGQAFAPEHGTK